MRASYHQQPAQYPSITPEQHFEAKAPSHTSATIMQTFSASSFTNSPTSPYRAGWPHLNPTPFSFQHKHNRIHSSMDVSSSYIVKDKNKTDGREDLSRRCLLFLLSSGLFASYSTSAKAKSKSPYDERRLLEQNRRIQEANKAPKDFPNFIREGFEVKVVTSDSFVKCDSGLIYLDIVAGKGDCPRDGQQVTFHYIGYNESGRRIDSSYSQGAPAKIRMGTNSLVPGFEEGIKDMRPGGKRRIIIPPELGPPVGPSTFFSSKQFEVFDVELLNIQNCERRTILAFYSDVVCN